MRIVQLTGGWNTNIGNAFIALGSRQSILATGLDIDFHFVCELCADILLDIDFDVLVMSGSILTDDNLYFKYTELFKELREKNKRLKIILNGVAGWRYNDYEIDAMRNFCNKVKIDLLISRDMWTYENYKNYVNAYAGIDCGFFIADYYKPVKMRGEYALLVDSLAQVQSKYFVVTMSHNKKQPKNFVSEFPEDYFDLYANAKEVFSYRVHGCVLACAYGIPTKLLKDDNKRNTLFNMIGYRPNIDSGIPFNDRKMFIVDQEILRDLKKKQTMILKGVLSG